jgi:hypothetical protein
MNEILVITSKGLYLIQLNEPLKKTHYFSIDCDPIQLLDMIHEDQKYGYRYRVLFKNISDCLVFVVHQERNQVNFILKKCQIPKIDGVEGVIPYQKFIIFLVEQHSEKTLKIFMRGAEFKLLEVSRINLPKTFVIKLDDYEPDCLIA